MKRSEMLIHMQRAYGIRHVMVETGHLTVEAFMDELLQYMESKGILPPTITVLKDIYNRTEGTYGFDANEWEPENE